MKNYIDLLNIAFDECLNNDPKVMIFGLGVGDVGAVFGSMVNLQTKYGESRVFEIPLSENAVTGMALGLAIQGYKPVMVHQRADFSFTSAEQIINQIAKTRYTSGDFYTVPLVIRMIVGRGWGQGPTHAQSPHAIFSHVPGLRVVAPASPLDGYYLMKQSIASNDPIIFIEHRWLHQLTEKLIKDESESNLFSAKIMRSGTDLTMISLSYGVIESLKIAKVFEELGLNIEVINLRTIQPWDKETVLKSVRKTKKVVILDTGHLEFGLSSEISTYLYEQFFNNLSNSILRYGLPMEPTPSSPELAMLHYPQVENIINEIISHFSLHIESSQAVRTLKAMFPYKTKFRDQPDVGMVGPF